MIVVGTGQSAGSDGVQAAGEAARRAMARAATLKADLALLLLTPDHKEAIPRAVRQVRETTRAERVLGATVAGTLTTDGELDQEAAAVMVLGGDLQLLAGITPCAGRSHEAGRELGERVGRRSGKGALLLLLPDPVRLDPYAFLDGVRSGAPEVTLAGGGLAGDADGAVCFLDGRCEQGAVASLLIEGDFTPSLDLTHACQPLTEPMRVTRAAKNTILEIEGRPAVEALARAGEDHALGMSVHRAAELLVMGVMDDAGTGYVVRPLLGIDRARGAITAGDRIGEGQHVLFALREALSARDDLKAMLDRRASATKDRNVLGFYFNCAGRGQDLYGAPDVDSGLLQRRFGGGGILGLASSFELAGDEGRAQVHLYTGVLALCAYTS